MPLKIIVVGAGIAGLCAGIALRQAGHEVEVCLFADTPQAALCHTLPSPKRFFFESSANSSQLSLYLLIEYAGFPFRSTKSPSSQVK
jgi:protoporphyrinogen oxidase